jgi:hypothetical protein
MPGFFLDSENPKKKRENQINHQAQSSINIMWKDEIEIFS